MEDDADLRETIGEIFLARGYRVWQAKDGQDALDLVRRVGFRPDVVLLDANMPGMDGMSFLDARRDERLLATARVILITGAHQQASDIYATLAKPTELDHLIAVVESACHGAPAPTLRAG